MGITPETECMDLQPNSYISRFTFHLESFANWGLLSYSNEARAAFRQDRANSWITTKG